MNAYIRLRYLQETVSVVGTEAMQITLKDVLGTVLNCVAFEFYLLECDDV